MFAILFKLSIELGLTSERKLAQPVLIAACMTAVQMREQGGIGAGFRAALRDSGADRMARRRIGEQALPQRELRRFAADDKLIDPLLPKRAPGACRVWPTVFHNGFAGLSGTGLLRYGVTNAATVPGRVAGPAMGVLIPSLVSECETLSICQTFGPIAAASWLADEILCMTPVHPDHAFGRFLIADGLQ